MVKLFLNNYFSSNGNTIDDLISILVMRFRTLSLLALDVAVESLRIG